MKLHSSRLVSPLPSCLCSTTIIVLFNLFWMTLVSCSSKFDHGMYTDHCGSVVPEARPDDPESTTLPFAPNQDGYYLGGDELFNHPNSSGHHFFSSNRRVFVLRTEEVYKTDANDVYMVKATFILQTEGYVTIYDGDTGYTESREGAPDFELQGYWSQSTGKLCMVGSGSTTSSHDSQAKAFDAVLKLSEVKTSSDITSLITGTLESSSSEDDSAYFKPISLLMFPQARYKYTKVPKDFNHGYPGGIDVPDGSSLGLTLNNPICSVVNTYSSSFELEYGSDCKSSKRCNPFGEDLGYLPKVMSLSLIQCSDDKQSPRYLVEFPNSSYVDYYRSFYPNSSLVAEGSWDAKKKQLCIVACRILNASNSFGSSHVDDCSIGMSFRFPAIWSVENADAIVGYLWSNKRATDSRYFDRIKFRSSRSDTYQVKGLKYHYTQVDSATRICQKKKLSKKEGMKYPDGKGSEMQFSMSSKNSKGSVGWWGNSQPIFISDQPWNPYSMGYSRFGAANSQVDAKAIPSNPINISYQMTFTFYNESSTQTEMKITAEGAYDTGTGRLCMVGCRYLEADVQIQAKVGIDCEILVDLQFPPVNSNKRIEGKVESRRDKSSTLYFEPMSFSAVPYYSHGDTIWRMDFEIIMALISNTLVCIFVGYQILYVKKHPKVFPFISLVMLVVLTLGQMLPLVLNFEALFFSKQNRGGYISRAGGWLEVNEVLVRVITMVAFLLQFRLLQLVFSARLADGKQEASWIAEKKTLYVCLPLYIAGGLVAFLDNWNKYGFGEEMRSRRRFYLNHRSLWDDSRSYAGLVLDGFLFPQILLNIFQHSREHALSHIFYLGMTLVRLVPHAYDLYRAHHYVDDYAWSYMYAAPGADFYSTALDVIIPMVGLSFAALIFLQQRFGGRCFLPKRLKEMGQYEKLPVTDDP